MYSVVIFYVLPKLISGHILIRFVSFQERVFLGNILILYYLFRFYSEVRQRLFLILTWLEVSIALSFFLNSAICLIIIVWISFKLSLADVTRPKQNLISISRYLFIIHVPKLKTFLNLFVNTAITQSRVSKCFICFLNIRCIKSSQSTVLYAYLVWPSPIQLPASPIIPLIISQVNILINCIPLPVKIIKITGLTIAKIALIFPAYVLNVKVDVLVSGSFFNWS